MSFPIGILGPIRDLLPKGYKVTDSARTAVSHPYLENRLRPFLDALLETGLTGQLVEEATEFSQLAYLELAVLYLLVVKPCLEDKIVQQAIGLMECDAGTIWQTRFKVYRLMLKTNWWKKLDGLITPCPSFERLHIEGQPKDGEAGDCNICLSECPEVVGRMCGHMFCPSCNEADLEFNSRRGQEPKCPVCRQTKTDVINSNRGRFTNVFDWHRKMAVVRPYLEHFHRVIAGRIDDIQVFLQSVEDPVGSFVKAANAYKRDFPQAPWGYFSKKLSIKCPSNMVVQVYSSKKLGDWIVLTGYYGKDIYGVRGDPTWWPNDELLPSNVKFFFTAVVDTSAKKVATYHSWDYGRVSTHQVKRRVKTDGRWTTAVSNYFLVHVEWSDAVLLISGTGSFLAHSRADQYAELSLGRPRRGTNLPTLLVEGQVADWFDGPPPVGVEPSA